MGEINQKPGLKIDGFDIEVMGEDLVRKTFVHKTHFCLFIVLEGQVIVEVVLGNVRENFDIEINAQDSRLVYSL